MSLLCDCVEGNGSTQDEMKSTMDSIDEELWFVMLMVNCSRDHEHSFSPIWNKEYMFAWWILIGGRQSILSSPQWQGIDFIPQLHDSSRSIIVFIATLLYLQYGHLLQTCVLAALWQLGGAAKDAESQWGAGEKKRWCWEGANFIQFVLLGEWMNGWHACFQESVRGSDLPSFLKLTGFQTSSP